MKRVMLLVALAMAFLIGYGAAAKAWPGVNDRAEWHGYFRNQLDQWGGPVITSGIPGSVNSANSFISYIEGRLYSGNVHDSVGATFIIEYMLGYPWRRDWPVSGNDLMIWESEVRAAAAAGRVAWNTNFSFTVNSYYQNNYPDDAFYYETDTQPSILFRNANGSIAAVIKRSCGNIVANGNYYGFDENFTITGNTTVSNASPLPGQTVTWRHYIHNNGPTATASEWWAVMDGSSGQPTGLRSFATGPAALNVGQTLNVWNENFTVPANAPAGTRYCRQVGWDPINTAGARNGRGAQSCITVVVPEKIKATMNANPTHMSAGDTVTFTPGVSVQSAGNSVTVNCNIVRTIVGPGGAPTNVVTPAPACVDTAGNANIVVGPGGATLRANTYTSAGNIPVGSRVCDTITITNPTGPLYFNNAADTTATACVVIAKTPYVHFQGNDVWAGGGFPDVTPACNISANITTTANTLSDGSVAGSGVEYGAFALGRITNFGSAGRPIANAGAAFGKMLTFTNVNNASLGFYAAAQHCINNYVSNYSGIAPTAPANPIDVNRASVTMHINSGRTFHGTVPNGSLQVYLVEGDVTIDGDIKYSDSYGSQADIPSLVIIATGNILVRDSVQQMDGLFVARGTFNTCSNAPATLTTSTCNQQLTINGSVIASQLSLMRTGGAEGDNTARKTPAEIFNFNPEMYLRSALNGSGTNLLKTVDQKDLPPRY